MFRSLSLIVVVILSSSCMSSKSTPTKVGNVDLEKYAGIWYELASFPASFQKGCHCTTAEYQLTEKSYIRVINRCRRKAVDGKESGIRGRAYPVEGSNNTKLKVQFFWPFRGDYDIIMLAEDYSWAVVTSGKKYLWILSRTPEMDEKLFEELTIKLSAEGYDMSRLQRTVQACK
ncbi:MAG: lipocalin family protein [Bacteroidales bacterium]|nr:lipocalin family protein [Bacteroidales bacterium]